MSFAPVLAFLAVADVSKSELAHLAYLLRLAAMTGREIAATRSTDRSEILELVDRAEDVGRRLDEIARRGPGSQSPWTTSVRVSLGKKH